MMGSPCHHLELQKFSSDEMIVMLGGLVNIYTYADCLVTPSRNYPFMQAGRSLYPRSPPCQQHTGKIETKLTILLFGFNLCVMMKDIVRQGKYSLVDYERNILIN